MSLILNVIQRLEENPRRYSNVELALLVGQILASSPKRKELADLRRALVMSTKRLRRDSMLIRVSLASMIDGFEIAWY